MEVGIDAASVADIADSLDRFGDRFLRRVYTPAERAECGRRPERLAAVFAAKEAVLKALRPAGTAAPFRAIEVLGYPCARARLHPPLMADGAGHPPEILVTMSRDGDRVLAFALLVTGLGAT